MIVTVRYAAKLAVYVASINMVNIHQKLNMILPDADIGLCSSSTTKHAPYKTIKKHMSNDIRLQHLLEKFHENVENLVLMIIPLFNHH